MKSSGLLRADPASFGNSVEVDASRRKLRDLWSLRGMHFDLEYFRTDHLARRSFIHREEVAVYPIPAVIAMAVIGAHKNFHLRLAPEAGTVRRRNSCVWSKVAQGEFAIGAEEQNLGIGIASGQRIVGLEFKSRGLGQSHFVLRIVLHPLSAGADAAILCEDRDGSAQQDHQGRDDALYRPLLTSSSDAANLYGQGSSPETKLVLLSIYKPSSTSKLCRALVNAMPRLSRRLLLTESLSCWGHVTGVI